ncbi:MAG TPA: ABC transporter ATP-binding protein [Xanthobacteraceae bacterium]|nr:ABC transporter ATP-binding protein [Xanthobacteraceae bacterium]
MAQIELKNVVAEFPIYGSQPSLRKELVGRVVGGVLSQRRKDSNRVTIRALDGVTLTVYHGDQLGIIGHNGAGKSTLLRVFAGIYEPSQGTINIEGRVSPLFSTSPGLDLDDTGYENILTCGLLLGMSRGEIEQKLPEIAAFSELSDYLALPVRTYSTGMLVRLGFAIATAIDPEILLLDEELGAGDARFAMHAAKRVEALIERSSIVVLASQSEDLIRRICNRAILLDHGRIIADGPTEDVLEIQNRMNKENDAAANLPLQTGTEPEPDQATPMGASAV